MSPQLAPPEAQLSPLLKPQTYIGAASPLWAYFAGAALAGTTLWWMIRWMHPTVLAAAPKDLARTMERAAETVAELVGGHVAKAVVAEPVSPQPVGGEAAPVSPVLLDVAPIAEPRSLPESPPVAPAKPRRPRESASKPH